MRLLLLTLAFVSQMVAIGFAVADPYTVTVIPGTELPSGLLKPWLINDRCQILGSDQDGENSRVFRIYERGTVRAVTAPQPFTRNASAIAFTNRGEALIREGFPLGSSFLVRDAIARQLPPPPPARYPNGLFATDLSLSGHTLHVGVDQQGESLHSVLIRNRYVHLRTPGSFFAYHLNSALTLGGSMVVDPIFYHQRPALKIPGRGLVQLPVPPGTQSGWVHGLLESGRAFGSGDLLERDSSGGESIVRHALLWPTPYRLIDLNTEIGIEGADAWINHASERGPLLATAVQGNQGFQFLWDEHHGVRKLADLIPSAYERIEWVQPYSVNSAGQMVGLACFRDGPCQRVVVHPSDQRACAVA